MKLRALLSALALLAGVTFVAHAQEPAPAPPPTTAQEAAPAPEALEAGRNIARAIFIESGLLSLAVDGAIAGQWPALRERLATDPRLARFSSAERDQFMQIMDGAPVILREEIEAQTPALVERMAGEYARRVSTANLVRADAALHSDLARLAPQAIGNTTREALRAANNDFNRMDFRSAMRTLKEDELAALIRFAADPGGGAVMSVMNDMHLDRVVTESLQPAAIATMGRMFTQFCSTMERVCAADPT